MPDLSRMRNDYTLGRLREEDLAPTWVEQFDRWFADAVAAGIPAATCAGAAPKLCLVER